MSIEETTAVAVRLHGDVSFLDSLWPIIRKVAELVIRPVRWQLLLKRQLHPGLWTSFPGTRTQTIDRQNIQHQTRHAKHSCKGTRDSCPVNLHRAQQSTTRQTQNQPYPAHSKVGVCIPSVQTLACNKLTAVLKGHTGYQQHALGLPGHAAGSSNDRYLRQHVAGGQRSCKESISLQRTAAHAFPTVRTAMLAHPHLNTNLNCNTDKSRA
jgi:hypothetical protein